MLGECLLREKLGLPNFIAGGGNMVAKTVKERRVLPNCCEDWVLEYGQLHQVGALFKCLPCGHQWQRKTELGFLESQTNTLYLETEGERGIRYLKPAEGPEPIVKRCCSKLLCKYGSRVSTAVADFECPYCYTSWWIGPREVYGVRRIVYINIDTGVYFILEEHPFGNYLAPSPEQPHPVNV